MDINRFLSVIFISSSNLRGQLYYEWINHTLIKDEGPEFLNNFICITLEEVENIWNENKSFFSSDKAIINLIDLLKIKFLDISNAIWETDKENDIFSVSIEFANNDQLLKFYHRTAINWIQFFTRFLLNIKNDFYLIKNHFKIKDNDTINKILICSSDPHENGEHVLRFDFTDIKIIYKPRSIQSMDLLKKCIETVNLYLDKQLDYCDFLGLNNHGYIKFIDHVSINDSISLANYYYLLGVLGSLAYSLQTSDIHSENLIASNGTPIIIDTETVLTQGKFPANQSYFDFTNLYLSKSILKSNIFPKFTDNLKMNIFSFYGNENKSKNSEYRQHLPKTDISVDEIFSFQKNIVDGFIDGFRSILQSKSSLVDLLKKNYLIRIVCKDTFYYRLFLDDLKKKYGLRELSQKRLIDDYRKNNSEKYVEHELVQLLNFDIPIFYSYSLNTDIFTKGVDSVKCEVISPSENAIKKINSMDELDLSIQVDLIKKSLISIDRNKFSPKINDKTSMVNEFDINLLIKNIEKRIIDTGNGYHTIFTLYPLTSSNKATIAPIKSGIYDGIGGLIVFYSLLIDKKIITYRNSKIQNLFHTLEMIHKNKEYPFTSCPFNGGMSIYLSIFTYLYNMGDVNSAKKIIEDNIDIINRLIEDDNRIDYVGGLSGGVVALINIINKAPDLCCLNKTIERAVEKIKTALNELIHTKKILTGFSHGLSGMYYALGRYYAHSKKEEIVSIILNLLSIEDSFFNSDLGNWPDYRFNPQGDFTQFNWCHGQPGIIFSRALMNNIHPEIIQYNFDKIGIYQNSINKYLSINNKIGCLCHGSIGNSVVFKSIEKTWGSLVNIDKCIKLYDLEKINNNITEVYNLKSGGYGLFTGFPGIILGKLIIENKIDHNVFDLRF